MSERPEGAGGEGEEMGGVALSRYAGVRAGVGEGFELALVLACEEVDPAAWPRAERAWGARLAEEVDPTEGLGAAYAEHLAQAQARYGRRIRPIDETLRAWLDFRRAFELADDPPGFLAPLGVKPLEVARLHRTWSRRLAEDAALAEEARAVLAEERGPVPALSPERRVLEAPPPAARPAAAPPPPEPRAARLEAPATTSGSEEPGGAPPLYVPLPGWPSADGAAPLPARPDHETRAPHPAQAPVVWHTPVPTPSPAAFASAEFDESVDTLPGGHSPLARPALPFSPDAAPTPASISGPSPESAARPSRRNAPITAELPVFPPPELGGTVSPFQSALPFTPKGAAPAAAARVARREPTTAEIPVFPSPDLGGTVISAVSPFRSALPFAPASAPAVRPSEPAAPDPPTQPDMEGTAPAGPSLLRAALPFKKAEPAERPPTAPEGALTGAAARITLAHHASLTAEIAVAPGNAAAVYQRYGIGTPAEAQALDRAWRERLRLNPAEHREWQRLYATYCAYWAAHPHDENVPPR